MLELERELVVELVALGGEEAMISWPMDEGNGRGPVLSQATRATHANQRASRGSRFRRQWVGVAPPITNNVAQATSTRPAGARAFFYSLARIVIGRDRIAAALPPTQVMADGRQCDGTRRLPQKRVSPCANRTPP